MQTKQIQQASACHCQEDRHQPIHPLDLEDSIRRARGQAHALQAAMEQDHPGDPLIFAAESLMYALDQLAEQFLEINSAGKN